MKRLLKYTEVLEYLGICKSTDRKYHITDSIPVKKYGMSDDGKQMTRYYVVDVDRYCEKPPEEEYYQEMKQELLREK